MASLRPVEPAQHTTKELGLQVHGIEGVSDFIVVGFDLCYKGSRVSILSCELEQNSRHRRPGVEMRLSAVPEQHTFWDLFKALVI